LSQALLHFVSSPLEKGNKIAPLFIFNQPLCLFIIPVFKYSALIASCLFQVPYSNIWKFIFEIKNTKKKNR